MKKKSLLKLVLIVILAITVTLTPVISAYGAEAELLNEEQQVADFKAEVIRLVNVERAKLGVPELKPMDTLSAMADIRAKETATSFSHTRPDGTKWSTLFTENSMKYKAAGENLAYGFKAPETVVKAWMDSEGHRKNILDSDFEYIGIGFYKNENGRIYCSQFFYTPQAA